MKKIYLLTLTAILFINTGCVKKWLELEPKAEVSADVLLQTPEGFTVALNGIYTNMSSAVLYGGDLCYGLIDVLGRCYDPKNTPYDALKNYDYTSQEMSRYINQIWRLAYATIANCNGLLAELNKKAPGFFKEHERARLEGELLTIRAMLHFDLLRLYAPAPVVKDVAAIPYYPALSNAPMPDRQTSEILQMIISDLTKSKQIQKPFDTDAKAKENFLKFRFTYDSNEPSYFGSSKRGHHMGYYATTALLARVALYAGNMQLAYDNAIEIIDAQVIDFTPATKIDVGEYNRLLSDDILFALYRLEFDESFNKVTFLVANTNQIFGSDLNSDYRKKCYLTTDGALKLLNTLRTERGCTVPLSPFPTKNAFVDALINDARREFVGEGKMFFMYKRLNKTILDETNGNQTLTEKFVLPVTQR